MRSKSTFNRRLAALAEAEQLTRLRLPGSGEYLYSLGRAGVKACGRHLGRSLRPAIVNGRVQGGWFLEHDLQVTEFMLRVCLAYRDRLGEWWTDPEARDQFHAPAGGRLSVEPDAVFIISGPDGPRARWLEMETGSVGRRDIERKVEGLDQYYASGQFQARWQTERLLGLWVAPDEAHARRLRAWIGPRQPRLQHFFSSWDVIDADGIAGRIWLALNGGEADRRALVDSAPPLERK